MKLISFFILLISPLFLKSQTYINVVQNSYNSDYLVAQTINSESSLWRNFLENKRKKEEAVAKAQAQLSLIKNTYSSSKNYPETITNGWHTVIATDNYNYCSPAKVLISNNEIKEFVISNWVKLSMSFKVISPLKNAKALISVNFGESEDTLEVYFINDLQQPTIVEPPLQSGFITFWSDSKAKEAKIWVDKKSFGELSENLPSEPTCFGKGAITVEVKPGIHHFFVAGRGSIAWEGDLEVKENKCLIYLLNKDNKKN